MKRLIKRITIQTKLREINKKREVNEVWFEKEKTKAKIRKILMKNVELPDISVYFDSIPATKDPGEWLAEHNSVLLEMKE